MRRQVCHIQPLLALASTVILGSKSCGTCNHILLSQIQDFPFCRLLWLTGLQWRRYLTPPPHGIAKLCQSQRHIATDGQSIISFGVDQIFITLWQLVLFLWGALSNERTGLSFVYAAGPHQRSLSQFQVPWDPWPYFTVSDLRLPFSSPPTSRRFTVEVFSHLHRGEQSYVRANSPVLMLRRTM
jgi:hypothetical protein